MALTIEYLSPEELKPYANNAKRHPAEQIEQIKKSIEQFGFNDPVAVWKDNEVIEGHGRLISAVEMELEKIPVIRLDNLTDEERKAYALIHNKLTMNSGFDSTMLEFELEALQTSFDMKAFGFDESAFDASSLDDLFEDAPNKEREPKQVKCPHCGEWFEV